MILGISIICSQRSRQGGSLAVVKANSFDDIFNLCEGAYAPRTLSSYRSDLKRFQHWCKLNSENWLPAHPETVAGFINSQIAAYRVSTIKRRVSAITFAHRISDLPCPTSKSAVHLALRRASRTRAQRPQQAQGLTHKIVMQILDTPQRSLSELRDVALVSVGYDTLCRSAEISRMRVKHVSRVGAVPRAYLSHSLNQMLLATAVLRTYRLSRPSAWIAGSKQLRLMRDRSFRACTWRDLPAGRFKPPRSGVS